MYTKEWAIWLVIIKLDKEAGVNQIPDVTLDLDQECKETVNLEEYSKEWDITSSYIKERMTQLEKNLTEKLKYIKIWINQHWNKLMLRVSYIDIRVIWMGNKFARVAWDLGQGMNV